jgi:hypothetical protein
LKEREELVAIVEGVLQKNAYKPMSGAKVKGF